MSYTPKHRFFRIFVPKSPVTLIAPRSAIVAKDPLTVHDGRITVYYEGNLLGAENLHEFVQRLNSAAGRCSERYPTVAMASIELSELVDVGRFDLATGQMLNLDEPAALVAWLDGEDLPDIGATAFLLKIDEQGETLYWSNTDGWGERASAEVFSPGELSRINLPVAHVPVQIERALPTDGLNPLAQHLEALIADLDAIRLYAAPLLFRDGLVADVGRLVSAEAAETVEKILTQLAEACTKADEAPLGEIYRGRLSDELQHHIASDHAEERLEDAKAALANPNY